MALDFQGVGPTFPFQAKEGTLSSSDGIVLIKQSVRVILETRLGERPFRRDFGSRLHELLFQPLNDILIVTFQDYVLRALRQHERRARFVEVATTADQDSATLSTYIDFIVLSTNRRGNMVFPFFLRDQATT